MFSLNLYFVSVSKFNHFISGWLDGWLFLFKVFIFHVSLLTLQCAYVTTTYNSTPCFVTNLIPHSLCFIVLYIFVHYKRHMYYIRVEGEPVFYNIEQKARRHCNGTPARHNHLISDKRAQYTRLQWRHVIQKRCPKAVSARDNNLSIRTRRVVPHRAAPHPLSRDNGCAARGGRTRIVSRASLCRATCVEIVRVNAT